MFLGVGWGGAITFTYLRAPMMLRHGTFTCTCAHTSCKCSWKSPVGENRCVLSEDVEITGKNGCRWGFGHADFPKGTFSHSDMSTIYSKSQWKFQITIELTFMDNIKTWRNTAKRMIDFLPVTWKCCFYSAHFQPGGMIMVYYTIH